MAPRCSVACVVLLSLVVGMARTQNRSILYPGITMRLMQAATTSLAEDGIRVMCSSLKNFSLSEIALERWIPLVGRLKCTISRLQVEDCGFSRSSMMLGSGGVSLLVQHMEMNFTGKIGYHFKTLISMFETSKFLQFQVSSKTSLNLTSKLEKTDGGNLTINTEDCKLDFHHLKLIFPEIDNFMLRFLTDILSIPLRMQIHRLVCEKLINISEELEMELQQHIGLLPIWDYAALDTTLTSDPLVSSSFLQTQHSGALHVLGEAESDSKSFNSTPNALSIAVNPPRMMYIWVQKNVLEKIIQTFVTKELQRRHNWSSVKNTFQRTNFSRPFLRMMKKLFVQKGAASPVFDIRFPQLPLIYFVDEKFFVKGKAMGTIWRIGQPRRGRGDIGVKELNKAEQLSTFSVALTMEIFTDYKDGEITVTGVMQRLKVRLGKKSVLSTKDRARFLKVLKKFSRSGGFHTLLQSLEKDLGRIMQRQMKNLNLLSPSFYTREGNFCLETDFVVRKEFLSHVVKKLLEKHQLSSPAVSQTPTPFLNTTFS